MLNLKKLKGGRFLYCLLAFLSIVIAVRIYKAISQENFIGVGITGINHIGSDYNIAKFHVDGYWGANVGREGGGGSSVCCAMLPRKWRPELTVEVSWVVNDWSKEIIEETDAGNYESVTLEGVYKANVPVEKYDVPEQLYVHFFGGGKVRVLSSAYGPDNFMHAVRRNDPSAGAIATSGVRVERPN